MYNNSGYQQGGQFNGSMLPQRTGQQPLGYQQTGYSQLPPQQTGYQTGGFQQQQQQPQATGFQSQLNQPTGFSVQQPLYGQATGFVQPQQTGFVQPQQTGFVQPQQTGFISNQYGGQPQQSQFGLQQQQPLAPQKTGFSSAAQGVEKNEELKIPNIRLSFLTAHDQQKFEDLFRSAVPKKSYAITADAARDVLMRSGLQPAQLARIWELSDLNKSGQLLFPEFALALHLCNVALKGLPIPYQLELNVKNEVEGFVDAINFSIPDDDAPQRSTPFDNINSQPQQSSINQLSGIQMQPQQTGFQQPLLSQATGYQPLQPQRTGFQAIQPQTTGFQQPLQSQATGFQQPLQFQNTGYQSNYNPPALLQQQKTGGGNGMFTTPGLLQQQKTGVGNNNMFQSSYLQPQRTGFGGFQQYQNLPRQENQEFIKPQEKELFSKIFDTYDTSKKGQLDPQLSAEIFRKSGLNRSDLEKVWNLITNETTTHLNKESFSLGMWLIYRKLNGNELPNRLPESLLPDSVKNVNYVKDKLKTTPSFGKPSFSSFKNDDDRDMNSSRNRRKTDNDSKSSIDVLKRQVQEKQSQLNSLSAESAKKAEKNSKELQEIEELKNKIRTLPKPNTSTDTLQQKDKLNSLVSKVPNLISEISRIDNDITNSRIELYKIQHPSSIIGTGPNGEVTESDKRKAKSKALLAQRMAALTGKSVSDPTADFENEQQKLSEEVSAIKSKNKETQEIIYDIEKSIKDISQGVLNSLNNDNDPSSYRKWELGLDVQPDVAELIKSLRISSPSLQQNNRSQPSAPVPVSTSSPAPAVASPKPSTADSYASYKTPEDRAAYIKEQAKRKMNERLAKFGISRHGASKAEVPSPSVTPQASMSPPVQEKAPETPAPQASQPTQQPPAQSQRQPSFQAQIQAKSAPPPPPTSRTTPKSPAKTTNESEDEVDEEELKLRQQLEELKKKKKADKEARLEKLRKELEDAENDEDENTQEKPVKTFAPQPKVASPQVSNEVVTPSAPQPKAEPSASQDLKHHETNPFAKSQGPASISSNNPFGKPQQPQQPQKPAQSQAAKPQPPSQTPSFDAKNAEAQRKAQRGFENDDDDDGWGTEEDKSDDEDEIPNRQGAAHLAGLLFSGMGPPRTNPGSQVSTPKQEENKSFDNVKQKPVPIAPPIPSVSSPAPSANVVPQVEAPVEQQQPEESPVAPPILEAPVQETSIPPTPPSPPYPAEEGPADDAFAAHPHPEIQDESAQSDDDQFVDSLSTPAAPSPAPEAPPLPEANAPEFPGVNPPPLPEASAPQVPDVNPPPLPQVSAPPPPPLPQTSAPPTPSFTEQSVAPPLPESRAPPAPPLPDSSAPATPPLPQMSAPPPPPPLPQTNAPPAPPSDVPAAPPPPPPGPAPSATQSTPKPPAAAPIGGGLPFLADIQKRRDDRNVVG